MVAREEVLAFARRGPLPSDYDDATEVADIDARVNAIEAIQPPVTDEEAALLLEGFPEDGTNCFGVAWTLMHLIETAPNPAVPYEPPPGANEWHVRLWRRYQNGLDLDAGA